jgi:hypothetical protein
MRTKVSALHAWRVLCVFPAYAPAFGTFSHALRLVGAKAFMPPQGLLLIANYLRFSSASRRRSSMPLKQCTRSTTRLCR